MNEQQHAGGFRPRLPDDPAYWQGLAIRIVDSAEPSLAELRAGQPWWKPLARLAPAFGVGALAASLAAFVLLPDGSAPAPARAAAFADVFDPGDPVGAAFVGGSAPELTFLLVARTETGP